MDVYLSQIQRPKPQTFA